MMPTLPYSFLIQWINPNRASYNTLILNGISILAAPSNPKHAETTPVTPSIFQISPPPPKPCFTPNNLSVAGSNSVPFSNTTKLPRPSLRLLAASPTSVPQTQCLSPTAIPRPPLTIFTHLLHLPLPLPIIVVSLPLVLNLMLSPSSMNTTRSPPRTRPSGTKPTSRNTWAFMLTPKPGNTSLKPSTNFSVPLSAMPCLLWPYPRLKRSTAFLTEPNIALSSSATSIPTTGALPIASPL